MTHRDFKAWLFAAAFALATAMIGCSTGGAWAAVWKDSTPEGPVWRNHPCAGVTIESWWNIDPVVRIEARYGTVYVFGGELFYGEIEAPEQ